MNANRLPIGSFIRILKPNLQGVIDRLQQLGYRTIGPRVCDGAIVYDDLDDVAQLPIGVIDEQDGGKYRLTQTDQDSYFDYVVGPHSLKNFLFPPSDTILESTRVDGSWQIRAVESADQPLAVIGARGCDVQAVLIQDRVFLKGDFVDPAYRARRENLFLVAVNCRRAAATCFCHSMKTGPAVSTGYDLALTELDKHFVIGVGSQRGGEVVTATDWAPCSMKDIEAAKELPQALSRSMRRRGVQPPVTVNGAPRGRYLDTTDLQETLLDNLQHPRWDEVAERCLSCANCTMVCPTCFCSSVEEVADLTGDQVRRERRWASCFTAEHSYMNSGSVRKTTLSRYRQWLTHKLATWHDQFVTTGCTGCGRCITWCPVGIDLTEEVAAIRGDQS